MADGEISNSTGAGDATVRRRSSGFRLKRLRDAQSLPLGWRHLTAVDVEHLQKRVDETLADSHAALLDLETCMLTWASLVTGREAGQLVPLSLRIVPRGEPIDEQPAGLVKVQGQWGWWLPAAAPKDQQPAKPGSEGIRKWSAFVYLPATKRIVRLVDRCLRLRRAAVGRVFVTVAPVPLFENGRGLIKPMMDLLADRSRQAASRARRATTTPEAVARWLPAAMTHVAGGDEVPASIACGRTERIAETAIHYGSVALPDLAKRYGQAVEPIDLSMGHVPSRLADRYAGDRLTPTDAAVRRLAAKLRADLGGPGMDMAERHRAMTRYTVALLSFALAHRVRFGAMPSIAAVDVDTRFVWIADKTIRGHQAKRLVWVCDTARQQMQIYERHLDAVQGVLRATAADAVATLRSGDALALFDCVAGPVKRRTVNDAVTEALAHAGVAIPNAGRHWLRSALVGRCSSESLHALYGHGMLEDGIWDDAGGLDPCVYRADLARVLDPVLAAIGWVPCGVDPAP